MIEILTRFLRTLSTTVLDPAQFKAFVKPFVVRFEQFEKREHCDYQFAKIENIYDQKLCFQNCGYYYDYSGYGMTSEQTKAFLSNQQLHE